MKVKFYYVRHGETLFNLTRRMQGMCDSPLTEKGIKQAENTASALRKIHLDHIFSSSSLRAWDTAQIINRYHDCDITLLKDLKEFDFGDLDGELFSEFNDRIQPHRMADDWTDVNGENVEMFRIRAQRAFDQIISSCKDGDTVLIVSHGSYFMHLMKTLLEYDQQEYIRRMNSQDRPFVPNCSISEFAYEDGRFTLEKEPETADEFRGRTPKKVTFYYVRHGETEFNEEKRMQGWSDAPLTEKGISQVTQTAEKLKEIHFDRAYASTLERTRDTADIIIAKHLVSCTLDKRLRETFFGNYEGERYEQIWDELGPIYMNMDFSCAGGESREQIYARIREFLRDAADEAEDNDTILLVSHGTLYVCMLAALFGMTHKQIYEQAEGRNPTPNAGYAVIEYDNGQYILKKRMDEQD